MVTPKITQVATLGRPVVLARFDLALLSKQQPRVADFTTRDDAHIIIAMDIYQAFLASPDASKLSDDVELMYVNSGRTFSSAKTVANHLRVDRQNNIQIRNSQQVIGAIEGPDRAFFDVKNTVEFVSGGGEYLPGLDEFIVDKTITFPSFHVVTFSPDLRVSQIRIHWDQGGLLKQSGVIGMRGKNWPITDSKDQLRLISAANEKTSIPVRGRTIAKAEKETEPTLQKDALENEPKPTAARSVSPSKRPTKDPYASLDLFAPVEADPNTPPRSSFPANVLSPRPSAKPAQRDMGDLFVNSGTENRPPPLSPPKGAAGRFAPSRLWDETAGEDDDQYFKSRLPPKGAASAAALKKASHFEFEDFTTPAKPKPSIRHGNQPHFSLSGDTEADDAARAKPKTKPRGQSLRHYNIGDDYENADAEEPSKDDRQTFQPRKDVQTHFDINDAGPTADNKENLVHTGVLRKDQESHFEIQDASPSAGKAERPAAKVKPVSSVFSRNFDFSYPGS